MTTERKKPLGQPIILEEESSDESATPTSADVGRADALAESDELLESLWNAEADK